MNFRIKNAHSDEIVAIANKLSLQPETVAILSSRGIKTEEEIKYFLSPGRHHFKDPFLLGGVKETVERLQIAKEMEETVVVYGDYDADGICATAIMYLALTEFGINAVPFVPERATGYGLSTDNIDYIMDTYLPSLLITVDCGISGKKEVEYLKDLAVDVIVTDHHELPQELPDCTTVNCKIKSDYGFDGLCGAGVAFKIACALIGERAYKYLDYAALATIADSMPLTDENRDIVFEGVKAIKNGDASKGIRELIAIANVREVNSTALAFTIAPRINAAGRMGDANAALKLLISDDNGLIEQLSVKLNNYNVRRQADSELLYQGARQKLISTAYGKKIIILEDDEWNSGLVGIIASRLVEEFSRPVILFVNNNGNLHGSARSIESINIYDAITACSEHLTEFGGHAQAAGISISYENYPKFKKQLEDYIDKNYDYSCFKPSKTADILIEKPFTIALAKELNRLEPFGTANKKPLFAVQVGQTLVQPIKMGSPHLSIHTDYIDMLYFNALSSENMLSLPFEKQIIFEPNISVFNREESLKGYVKGVEYLIDDSIRTKLCAFKESLVTALNDNDDYLYVSEEMTEKLVNAAKEERFGTIFAVYNLDTLKDFDGLKNYDVCLYSPTSKNLVNSVIVGFNGAVPTGYKKIVYLDRPLGQVNFVEQIPETFINRARAAYRYCDLDVSKETFAEIFRRLSIYGGAMARSSVDFALNYDIGYKKMQTVFAMEVFLELGFINFNRGILRFNNKVKSKLSTSRIYYEIEKLKN